MLTSSSTLISLLFTISPLHTLADSSTNPNPCAPIFPNCNANPTVPDYQPLPISTTKSPDLPVELHYTTTCGRPVPGLPAQQKGNEPSQPTPQTRPPIIKSLTADAHIVQVSDLGYYQGLVLKRALWPGEQLDLWQESGDGSQKRCKASLTKTKGWSFADTGGKTAMQKYSVGECIPLVQVNRLALWRFRGRDGV